jgi:hypothetical protein
MIEERAATRKAGGESGSRQTAATGRAPPAVPWSRVRGRACVVARCSAV